MSEIGEVATPKRKMQKKRTSEHGSPSRFPLHNQSINTSALEKLVKAGWNLGTMEESICASTDALLTFYLGT